ncbi:GAF domain-containing protein, partial [Arthrospira platensis SPKY2]
VEHASQDERFKENPLVTGYPNIEFYAGKPIISPEGYPFGTLCVIDTKPRKLTETQLEMLGDLARQVEVLLELKAKKMELQQSNHKLEERTDLLRTFFEVSQDLIGVIQPSGKLLAWNHSWSDELFFENDEIAKFNVWDIIHSE